MWNRVPGQTAADVNLDASPYGFKVTGDGAWDSDSSDAVDKPAFRSRELGVMDSNGHITNLLLVSGHQMLVPAAVAAVKQWRYKPYLLNGQPVEVETTITVIFTLSS